MLSELLTNPLSFFVWIAALLQAITVHEFAHAWSANYLGDPTARLRGRLTLNPLAHLDPIGTLAILLLNFGWGKPVPVDDYNLHNPRRDSALISLAGPASNLLLAIALSIFLRLLSLYSSIGSILLPLIIINVSLGIFNLLPIHPLDGGKILVGILPADSAQKVEQFLEQYGLMLLIFLMLPIFGRSLAITFIMPIINLILKLLLPGSPLN